jgi:hypothetical protein
MEYGEEYYSEEEMSDVFEILSDLLSEIADVFPIRPNLVGEEDLFMLTFHEEIDEDIEWKFPNDTKVKFKYNKDGFPMIQEMGDIFPYFVLLNKVLKEKGFNELDGKLYHITNYGSFYFGNIF